jgi:hypothetical protein
VLVEHERDLIGNAWMIGYTGVTFLASVLLLALEMWTEAFVALALAAAMLMVTLRQARKS